MVLQNARYFGPKGVGLFLEACPVRRTARGQTGYVPNGANRNTLGASAESHVLSGISTKSHVPSGISAESHVLSGISAKSHVSSWCKCKKSRAIWHKCKRSRSVRHKCKKSCTVWHQCKKSHKKAAQAPPSVSAKSRAGRHEHELSRLPAIFVPNSTRPFAGARLNYAYPARQHETFLHVWASVLSHGTLLTSVLSTA